MNVPRKLGDFEVKRRIGSGGMAEVFLATKRGAKGTEKRLVVKRLLPEHARSERLRQMFIHEAHLAMRLAHPNLVHVYELTDDPEGGLLLSMEYVDGADLGRVLAAVKKRGARIPEIIAARIVEQAARGLHHAHEYRDEGEAPLAIVHRDISPQNILVSRDGVVKVGDLGVAAARFVRDQTGVQPGKLRYMSPEQARGEKVDRRCDVYALGIVLHELLCLASPYGARRSAALARAVSHGRLDRPIAQNPDIPADLAAVLEGALAPDVAHRTATARDLADALAQVLFDRRAHVDEAAVELALAPYLDPESELAAGTGPSGVGSGSDLPLGSGGSSAASGSASGTPLAGVSGSGSGAGSLPRAPSAPSIPPPGDARGADRLSSLPAPAGAPDETTAAAAPRARRLADRDLDSDHEHRSDHEHAHGRDHDDDHARGRDHAHGRDDGSARARDDDDSARARDDAHDRRRDHDPGFDFDPALSLSEGDTFDRYVLESNIGRGGMADVYRARDTRLGREVALKLLRPDAGGASRERLLLEAQAAATFQHPGSVVVFDVGEHDGVPFIAMELVRGRTLATYLGDPFIPVARRIRWAVAIARVLAAAHRAGLVHRDVKPSNVMVRDDGELKVLDFGIVRRHTADLGGTGVPALTAAGTILGTPGYAAPEQLRGDPVDSRADQFAWAVTAYELLACRRPWKGDSTTVLVAQMLLFSFPPLASVAPDAPAPVAAAIDRALSREPADRFDTLDEVADILAPFAEPDPTPAARGPLSSIPLSSIPLPPGAVDIDPLALRPASLPAFAHPSKPAGPTPRPRPARHLVAALAASAALGALAAAYFARGPSTPTSASQGPATTAAPAPLLASLRCETATLTALAAASASPAPSASLAAASPASPAASASLAAASPASPAASASPAPSASASPATASTSSPAAIPDTEIARALGIGACARLAVELGIPWSDAASPHTLTVRASLADAATTIDLAVAGQTAAATAREPVKAVELAAAALAAKVAPVPLTPAQIAAWGAADEAGARRIARVFRRRELRFAPDIGTETVRLADTDPGSPFSHLLLLMNVAGSGEMLEKARERTLERLDKLPPSRQHTLRGLLLVYPVELDRKEATRLLRAGYAEAPDDHEMVSLYVTLALRLGLPEAFSALDRLIAAAPTRAIVPIENAMLRAPGDDTSRAEYYARRWIDIFPEARATGPVVSTFARAGKVDEALASLAHGRRLGLFAIGEAVAYDGGLMDLELFRLETARARAIATSLLGDPRPYARAQGLDGQVTSLFLEGRLTEALAAIASGAKLGADTGYPQGAAHLLLRALAAGRWLGRPTLDPAQIAWLTAAARAPDQLTRLQRAEAFVELALLAAGPTADRARTAALEAVDALARETADDPSLHDDVLLQTLPLVRALRGDKAAAAVFHAAARARPVARVRRAIDAALLFESLGDPAAAARAYRTCADPGTARASGLERVIAAVRLARLPAEAPAADPSASPAPTTDRDLPKKLASTADPGLLPAIDKMK